MQNVVQDNYNMRKLGWCLYPVRTLNPIWLPTSSVVHCANLHPYSTKFVHVIHDVSAGGYSMHYVGSREHMRHNLVAYWCPRQCIPR